MKKLHYLTIIVILFLSYFISCTQEDNDNDNDNMESFPPNTEIGANTFMFRVNGGEIINSEVGYLPVKPRIYLYYCHIDTYSNNDFLFHIEGNKCILGQNKNVSIYIKSMTNSGKYKLHAPPEHYTDFADYAEYSLYEDTALYYLTDAEYFGEMNITKLDTVNHIISGKFKFNAKQYCWEEECDDVITVDGQFDVRYIPNEGVSYY